MAAAVAAHVHQWDHHEVCLFAIPGIVDPSGSSFRLPVFEKLRKFSMRSFSDGVMMALIDVEGTHDMNLEDLRRGLMFPDRMWNLFICRYDAQPNFTAANGTEYRVRHTVQNLRGRVTEFRELQTRITIDHETGRTDVKKVMRFVFGDVAPMEPAHVSTLSALALASASTITASTTESNYLSTPSTSTIMSTTAWTPEVSTLATLSMARVSTLTRTS